jgi:tRNA (cmo5U34)-methyltransferase
VIISKLFNEIAAEYDQDRCKLIPCFNDFYRVALDVIPFSRERELRILDLGSGTGILAKELAKRYQHGQLTLIDISSQMLHYAEQKFSAEEKNRASFLVADYLHTGFQGSYDLIISALSIHHLSHGDKRELFAKIFSSLDRGGMFINCEQIKGATQLADKMYHRAWIREVKERGM